MRWPPSSRHGRRCWRIRANPADAAARSRAAMSDHSSAGCGRSRRARIHQTPAQRSARRGCRPRALAPIRYRNQVRSNIDVTRVQEDNGCTAWPPIDTLRGKHMSSIDEDPDESDMDSTDDETATVECPYCGEEVSDFAQCCPNCDQYISQEDAPRRSPAKWIVVGVILAIAVTLLWVVLG